MIEDRTLKLITSTSGRWSFLERIRSEEGKVMLLGKKIESQKTEKRGEKEKSSQEWKDEGKINSLP